MKMKKNVAVIGCGWWGKNIVRNFYELGALNTACDLNLNTLSSIKTKFPAVKITSDFDKVLSSNAIKAVAIATPAVTHYTIAKKAILAGKDVFVEKPLAMNTKQAEELVKLAGKKHKILMIGHILQYHPALIKLKEMIEEGNLGKIQYIYSNRLNIGKLRTEENILWSFAPHDISAILMLLDEQPVKVSSFGGNYITEGVYDTTLTTLEFKNGIRGHIFVSWLHPYKEQKLIIVGTKAMAVFDDVSKEKLFVYPHKIEYKSGKIPVAQKAEHYAVPLEDKEPLKEELKHFIESITKRKNPKTDGEEGLRVLKILEEAEKCLQSHIVIASNVSDVITGDTSHVIARSFVTEGGRTTKPVALLASLRGRSGPLGRQSPYFIHPASCVDDDVAIGRGTKIWHFSHILNGSNIGKNCRIGQNVVIGPDVTLGSNCKIQNNISIYKGVTLEDDVFCGPSCVFTNVYNPRSAVPRMNELKETLVKKGATIGANATIICGRTIGKCSFIGAGAVVTKDVPDYGLIYGNPAKLQGWMCECGEKLKFAKNKAHCLKCNGQYKKSGNTVQKLKSEKI